MLTLSIIVGGLCLLGALIALAIGIAVVMGGNDRDAVSSAREGWIQSRSGGDDNGELE